MDNKNTKAGITVWYWKPSRKKEEEAEKKLGGEWLGRDGGVEEAGKQDHRWPVSMPASPWTSGTKESNNTMVGTENCILSRMYHITDKQVFDLASVPQGASLSAGAMAY